MEELRYQRKITQEEYLHDVVSQRQYYRYRKGESEVPFEIIEKLITKLGIPYIKLISQFIEETEKGKKLVQEYFNLVINKKSKEAERIFAKLDNNNLIDEDSVKLVKTGNIILNYNRGFFSKLELCTQLKENINYKVILKKEALHDFEIYLLGLIMEYSDIDRPIILEKLITILKNDSLYIGDNKVYLMHVYFWVIKHLGREKRYIELIEYANMAIYNAHKYFTFYCLNNFHYYKALAHKRLNQDTEFKEALYKAIIICVYQNNDKNTKFLETIKKDTGIDPIDFIKNNLDYFDNI